MRAAIALTLLAAAAPVWAQFTELAATDDGQDLYFSSPLRIQPPTATSPESRVFHAGPGGVELIAERGTLAPNNSSSSSGDGIGQAQVSGDGSLIGVTAHNICPGGGPCTNPVQTEGLLRGVKSADLGPGALLLSRNGRWAVLRQTALSLPPQPPSMTVTATMIDLQSNQAGAIPPPAADYGVLASNGAVVVTQANSSGGNALGIWRQGQFTPVTISGAIRPLALSDDAGTLVFTRANLPPGVGANLIARNLSTGGETTLYASASSPYASTNLVALPNFLSVSNDGSRVLYNVWNGQSAGTAFIGNTADGSSIPLPLDPGELAVAGALSGSANAAFLATTTGRIVRFSLSAGGASAPVTLIPPTPYISQANFNFAPGSMVHLQGALPPSADVLAGHIVLDNRIVPVLYAGPDDIRAQIPWEQKIGLANLLVNLPSGSPFYQNDQIFVAGYAPGIERADPGESMILGLKLVKGDFSGLVTAQPQPGDLIVAYFTGLGEVSGSVQTGMPAPTDSLRPIMAQLTCGFEPGQSLMKTVYAGLAPLLIGIYQVTFQMPPDAGKTPIAGIQCSISGPDGGVGFAIVGAPSVPAVGVASP